MTTQKKFLSVFGLILFYTGAVLGMVLFGGLTWAGLEASFYFGYTGGAATTLRMDCPRILTTHQSGVVAAIVTNRTDQTIRPTYEIQISGAIPSDVRTQPSIDPGKTVRVTWPVSAEDVDFGSLILVQVYQNPTYKTPTGLGTCGTLFLNLGHVTGEEVYFLFLAAGLLGMLGGALLWLLGNRPLLGNSPEQLRGLIFLGLLVLVGILFASFGHWGWGLFALMLSLLTLVVLLGRKLMPS